MLHGTCSARFGRRTANHPAIVVQGVYVYNHLAQRSSNPYEAVIDTAADRSVVPISLAMSLPLKETRRRTITGYDGRQALQPIVYCKIEVPRIGLIPLSPIAVDSDVVLLGRDFLSRFPGLCLIADHGIGRWYLGRPTFLFRRLIQHGGGAFLR